VSEHIFRSLEDDPARALDTRDDRFADLQAGATQGIGWNRDLMLGADSSRATLPFLYFLHKSKG